MSVRLLALSDVHVNHGRNREALAALPDQGDAWLILAGDVADRMEHVAETLDLLAPKVGRLIWVPGNHELWAVGAGAPKGVARYQQLVALCRERGVLTPEDPYEPFPGRPDLYVCPLFLLYDYSFAPDGMSPDAAVAWAAEDGIRCVDDTLLAPDPYPSRQAWCAARLQTTAARLDALPDGARTLLINHWPLRRDLVRLYRIPRFSPWCGTRATEDWHRRYRAEVVVSGHLHMRATDWRDGTRFEEVSLGYPKHWRPEKGAEGYLRTILPGPGAPAGGHGGPEWRF